MKLFPRGLAPVTQTLSLLSTSFDFRFAKNSVPELSPGYATVSKSTVKNCQDLLEVTTLKPSAKGAANSSFRNVPYRKPSTSKTTTEMQFIMDLS